VLLGAKKTFPTRETNPCQVRSSTCTMIRICVPFACSLPNLLSFSCSNDIDWQAQDRNSSMGPTGRNLETQHSPRSSETISLYLLVWYADAYVACMPVSIPNDRLAIRVLPKLSPRLTVRCTNAF